MYLNKLTLIGFLGNDAEVRHTNDGNQVVTLSLATKSVRKKGQQRTYETEWHKLIVFGRAAEYAAGLRKGTHLLAEGELRSRTYESARTGTQRTVWEVRVTHLTKLDRSDRETVDGDSTTNYASAGAS